MTTLYRQNVLLVSEDWLRVYEALQNVSFQAYDFDNLVQALMNYLRTNYPNQFNDWISSSEFVTKIEVLAWLSQNISFRVDMNTRENFLATAERRESVLRLAQNIAYKVSRVVGASGNVNVVSIQTNQPLTDSDNIQLQNTEIFWNDPTNENWFEQFITVMNSALTARTQYGRSLVRYFGTNSTRIDQYVFNSIAPTAGTYPFSATVGGQSLPFEVYNATLDPATGEIDEMVPQPTNAFRILYMSDGLGTSSPGTGFFLPIKQGSLAYSDQSFTTPTPVQTYTISVANINNTDVYVQQLDDNGNVIANWTQVDTVFESVSFSSNTTTPQTIFEVDTLSNDNVLIRFGDGTFGAIPVGNFRFWYRTSAATPSQVQPDNITNQTITVPYVNSNQLFYLTIKFSLTTALTNAAASQTNQDIQTRANMAFYTQNRMITGQDYNSFFLNDDAILKVKSVNRTFSGQSRYAKLHDPTSLYENARVIGDDGRLYQQTTRQVQYVSANQDVLSVDALFDQYIRPIIAKADKSGLYYTYYLPFLFPSGTTWNLGNQLGADSQGTLNYNNVTQPVGSGVGTGAFGYVQTDSLIAWGSATGTYVYVDSVSSNGLTQNAILLRGTVANGEPINSVMPPLRNAFVNAEAGAIKQQLGLQITFGMGWNQTSQSWVIIDYTDLDLIGPFSLLNQGNTTHSGLDASWMFYLQYLPGQNGNDPQWMILDRGSAVFFESVSEVGFYFANYQPFVDTFGHLVNDTVTVLGINESKYSLRRRNLTQFVTSTCGVLAEEFQGTGIQTVFKLSEHPLNAQTTAVFLNQQLQINGVDYFIIPDVTGDNISFYTTPALGSSVVVYLSDAFIYATQTVNGFVGNGTSQELSLGVQNARVENMFSAIDGVFQDPGRDYSVAALAGLAQINFPAPIPLGAELNFFCLGQVLSNIFVKTDATGDGVTTSFQCNVPNQTANSIVVIVDGIWQTPGVDYTVDATSVQALTLGSSLIDFPTAPPIGVGIIIYAAQTPNMLRSDSYTYVGDGMTSIFNMPGLINLTSEMIIVTQDGVYQQGPTVPNPAWIMNGDAAIQFNMAPEPTARITIYVIVGALGLSMNLSNFIYGTGTVTPLPNYDVESCLISYLGNDSIWNTSGPLLTPDGYPYRRGIQISPIDLDLDGYPDDPYMFGELVIGDGYTDLVIWQKNVEYGFTVWQALNQNTTPAATYGIEFRTGIQAGVPFDTTTTNAGDIYYDITAAQYLTADATSGNWIVAPTQSNYRNAIGRDYLKFIWTHWASDGARIDPSVSNVMDTYILTSTYNSAYQTWISNNGNSLTEPLAPTSDTLAVQFANFGAYKAVNDAIIYHSARFIPLFGPQADPSLRANFLLIQSPGSTVAQNDLILRVLRAIQIFFDPSIWEFGATFYFTELAAFIHSTLAPDVQSVVIVPVDTTQAFGRLFQIQAQADELFISAAQPSNVQIVSSFTDQQLGIGTLG